MTDPTDPGGPSDPNDTFHWPGHAAPDPSTDPKRIVCLSGYNAETVDAPSGPEPDGDGHIVSGTVVGRPDASGPGSLAPVRAVVAHGVAASTAAAMLRKMADLVESAPELLSETPGFGARQTGPGTADRVRITPEDLERLVQKAPEGVRERLVRALDDLRRSLRDG